jgi:ribosome-associated toxin RatA of RatAB toxin-antitoxin module
MKTVEKSVLIWYTAQEMFDLVIDVDHYADFLPWCDQARAVERHEQGMTAEIGIAFAGIHQKFVTRNTHVPGREVHVKLVSGPFSNLDGHWKFTPVGQAGERACRIDLELQYGFKNAALAALVGPVFDKIASTMVDAFVKRAEHVYG